MKLQLRLGLQCDVCGELLDDERRVADVVYARIAGVEDRPYGLCPGCLQAVGPVTQRDPEYRRRARVRAFQRFGIVARTP